ncbi:MAG: hypothetical protein GVY19_06700 [Bacteroidetes bacterium]|jgi:hypothetical protein|nr:hypothetical protein [Bacteroidota bacterium]
MGMLSKELHRKIYIAGLILIVVSLPLSRFGLSVGQLLLAVNWLLEGEFKNKFSKLKQHQYSLAIFISIYLVYLLGLINTENIKAGIVDLRIKLPLLALPLIIGTSAPIKNIQFKNVLYFFIAAVFAGTVASMIRYANFYNVEAFDTRDLSVFISHIRFSLLINMAIFTATYFLIYQRNKMNPSEKWALAVVGIWFIIFLGIMHTLTGIVVFVVVSTSIGVGRLVLNKKIRWVGISLAIIIALVLFLYIHSIARLLRQPAEGFSQLKTESIQGNTYYNDTSQTFVENNHYIWVHIAETELMEEWNERSNIDYNEHDKRNQAIKHTLIRYLTSKELTKDSVGVWSLNKQDIKNIEGGMSNYLFDKRSGIFKRIYQLFWEIDIYEKGGNASGHSLLQRIEFLKIAFYIIDEHFWWGVGTGDVHEAFSNAYQQTDTTLKKAYWHSAHNQYVTSLLVFGIFGCTWIWFAFFYPLFARNIHKDQLAQVFIMIVLLSMINEDTLETHIGVSFVAFFYAFFIFREKINYPEHDTTS